MVSKFLKAIIIALSLSPMLIGYWIKYFTQKFNILSGWYFLALFSLSVIILFYILKTIKNKFEAIPISISYSDINDTKYKDIYLSFIYLIPLFISNQIVVLSLIITCFVIFYLTNTYYLNFIVSMLGYHQYQIKLDKSKTFFLITKESTSINQIENVVQIDKYLLLEKEQT